MPELIQDAATPEALAAALRQHLQAPQAVKDALQSNFGEIAAQLRVNADQLAAAAVLETVSMKPSAP